LETKREKGEYAAARRIRSSVNPVKRMGVETRGGRKSMRKVRTER
jgi:hypothetical protein